MEGTASGQAPWGHPSLEESGQNSEFTVGLPAFLLAYSSRITSRALSPGGTIPGSQSGLGPEGGCPLTLTLWAIGKSLHPLVSRPLPQAQVSSQRPPEKHQEHPSQRRGATGEKARPAEPPINASFLMMPPRVQTQTPQNLETLQSGHHCQDLPAHREEHGSPRGLTSAEHGPQAPSHTFLGAQS